MNDFLLVDYYETLYQENNMHENRTIVNQRLTRTSGAIRTIDHNPLFTNKHRYMLLHFTETIGSGP